MDLNTALEELSWIPRPRILALRRLGIARVRDLLTHYPRRYENRVEFPSFPRDETVDPVCLCGDVVKTRLMRFGGRKIFEALLEESSAHALSQPLTCRWFNLHYIQKIIATGQRLIIFGRVKRKGLRLVVDHPECEVIEDDEEILIHFRRITPIYPATEGLSQRVLRGLIFRLLEQVDVERRYIGVAKIHQLCDERERRSEQRRLPVGRREAAQHARDLGRLKPIMAPIDREVRRRLAHRQGEPGGRSVPKNAIAVYPTTLDVLHIVIKNENVALGHQLEVADIREKIRLHDRNDHCGLSPRERGRRRPGRPATAPASPRQPDAGRGAVSAPHCPGSLLHRATGALRTSTEVSQRP